MSGRAGAVLVAVVVAAMLGPGSVAHAHGGAAVFEVLTLEEVAPGSVRLEVAVTYESDAEAAGGAIVDVVAAGGDGVATAAVRLERTTDVGVYATTLPLPAPGRWTLTLTSSFPPGTLAVPVPVPVPAAGEGGDGGTTTAGPAEPTTTSASPLPQPEVGGAEGGADPTNLIIAALSGLLGGGLGLWASKRRSERRRSAGGSGR